jgi:hypothetical protein
LFFSPAVGRREKAAKVRLSRGFGAPSSASKGKKAKGAAADSDAEEPEEDAAEGGAAEGEGDEGDAEEGEGDEGDAEEGDVEAALDKAKQELLALRLPQAAVHVNASAGGDLKVDTSPVDGPSIVNAFGKNVKVNSPELKVLFADLEKDLADKNGKSRGEMAELVLNVFKKHPKLQALGVVLLGHALADRDDQFVQELLSRSQAKLPDEP